MILKTIKREKNLEYWDEIDGLFWELLIKLAEHSATDMGMFLERNWTRLDEKDRTVSDQFLDARFDIEQMVLNYLEKLNGAWFPNVEDNDD